MPKDSKDTQACILRNNHYSNILQVSKNGEKLATINLKRANWYVKKGLGELIIEERDGYKGFLYLNFDNKMRNSLKLSDIAPTQNRCVICGGKPPDIDLTLHHVTPKSLRVYFPLKNKQYDREHCVLLCKKCHVKVEQELYRDFHFRFSRKLENFLQMLKRIIVKCYIKIHGGPDKINQKFKKLFLSIEPKYMPDHYLKDKDKDK